jgi:rfaE bifunctional protein kinase chain/domain
LSSFGGTQPDRFETLLARFSTQRILVVGDMVADEYIFGAPQRISREAPVVILEFSRRIMVPGGATNVAVNLRALGAQVAVVGVIGADDAGIELRGALEALGIDTRGLIVDSKRPTSTATRIIGGGVQVVQQQIVRIDRIVSELVVGKAKDDLLHALDQALPTTTGVILSDYEHGVLDPSITVRCLADATRRGLVSTVDAHGDLLRFKGVTLATPNQPEAEVAVGRRLTNDVDLRAACQELLDGMDAAGIIITRGAQGMVGLDDLGRFNILPAYNLVEVRDATGAGDTVASTATLALCAGGTLAEAAVMGNAAAALVVRHFGAATVTPPELASALAEVQGRAGAPETSASLGN